MNYFSYFSEIEDTFIRRRGKHLMLSPLDWALIESWKDRGIPLHVALRGIEHAFDSHDAKKQKRTVKTLLYCQEEVEAQYLEWLESRVGSHDEAAATEEIDERSAFPRATVMAHLERSHKELSQLAEKHHAAADMHFEEALARSVHLLGEIKDDYANTAKADARKLEESLTGLDRLLDDAIRNTVSEREMSALVEEVDTQIKPYKRQMDKEAYTQTRDNLVRKRLREHFRVPRLSLFFV